MSSAPHYRDYRLRRNGAGDVLEGLSYDDLKALADWAQLHPRDEVSRDGRIWIHVHQFKELEMVWNILQDGVVVYGPASVGALKEFFVNGDIPAEQRLRHHLSGETKTLRQVIGDEYIHKVEGQATAPVTVEEMDHDRRSRIEDLESELHQARRALQTLGNEYRAAMKTLR